MFSAEPLRVIVDFLLSEVGRWMGRKKQYSNVLWPTFLTHWRLT